MIGVLQYLVVVVILLWMFWRIFGKVGCSPRWAYLMAIPFVGLFLPLPVAIGLLIGVPIVVIWVFAFVAWPSIDNPPALAETPGYAPPAPERFKGRFRRSARPSGPPARRRRGIVRRPGRRRDDE